MPARLDMAEADTWSIFQAPPVAISLVELRNMLHTRKIGVDDQVVFCFSRAIANTL